MRHIERKRLTDRNRFTFWLAAIINGISMILFVLFYFPATFKELQVGKSRMEQLRQIDYIGFTLYAGGVICLLLSLSASETFETWFSVTNAFLPAWGGQTYPWSSPTIITLLVVAFVALVGFVLFGMFHRYSGS
jgi:hypothetical protein